jgi:glutathione peroxidase
MSLYDHPINTLDGSPLELQDLADKTVLIVNVASRCGLTPQYEGLEHLQERYADKGFTVLGVPCNQFGEQEPCSTTYGVTFPMTEKIEVNGEGRHPLYEDLTSVADAEGAAGDIQWNFEKFLVTPGGEVKRFRPMTEPESDELTGAIEAALLA